MIPAPAHEPTSAGLIEQLGNVCRNRGLPEMASSLLAFQAWIRADLDDFETELAVIPRGARVIQKSAHHLLDLGGKHVRPMCVAIAAKLGTGFGREARSFAVAVELVHTATLLHDDVVDLGDRRRGAPAARMIYGNAASVFAGDWLLVHALRRVQAAGVPGVLDRMLDIIDEMILAESLQLERRGLIDVDLDSYFRVVEGKTAALFRWAMWAGGRAGGLDEAQCDALENYGLHLGVAFQAVDDALDFASDNRVTGKSMYTDLREGKMTYPLVVAMGRDHSLRPVLEQLMAEEATAIPAAVVRTVAASMERTGALADCRALARDRVDQAIECLTALPSGAAKSALVTVARATAHREK